MQSCSISGGAPHITADGSSPWKVRAANGVTTPQTVSLTMTCQTGSTGGATAASKTSNSINIEFVPDCRGVLSAKSLNSLNYQVPYVSTTSTLTSNFGGFWIWFDLSAPTLCPVDSCVISSGATTNTNMGPGT